ncbi:MAG: CHC2 zinc finger domain-containing protein, partial [Solirubrobacteraceae bacterium]
SVGPLECERANRRLAHRLGGDPVAVDASRLLRPPCSWNYKYRPREPVRLLELDQRRSYDLSELIDDLVEPPGRRAHRRSPRARELQHPLDRVLLGIPAEQYVLALTGREANRAGKVHCPFHDDRRPSLQLYDDGSWYCFGPCRRGGTIYDFAAALWLTGQSRDGKLRGREFLRVRQRLAEIFLG